MKYKQQNEQASFKDPVCGMEVSRNTAAAESHYEDTTYYFCADVCREKFDAEPEKYIGQLRR